MWRSRRKDPMMMRERQIEKCGHYRGGCMNTAGEFLKEDADLSVFDVSVNEKNLRYRTDFV